MSGTLLRTTIALALVAVFGLSLAQTPDLSKVSLRLTDWVYKNEGNSSRQAIGVQLASPIDIHALDQELYARKALPQERVKAVIAALKSNARATQPQFVNWVRLVPGTDLSEAEQFWGGNLVFLEANSDAIKAISLHPIVEFIDLNAAAAYDEPVEMNALPTPKTVNGHEPGHDAIGAPTMWAMGYSGYGRLAMGIDTGVDPNHPALSKSYQGNFKPADQSFFVANNPNNNTAYDCGSTTHGTRQANGFFYSQSICR